MKVNRLILFLSSALLLSGCTLPFGGRKAGIQITTNPQANVSLDGKSLGSTPVYQEGLKAGAYNIKITANDSSLTPWEGKVTLNPGVLTVVDRQLSNDPAKSFGYTLSFETLTDKTATEVNIVSFPDLVSVMVDGAPVGFTPFKSDVVTAGAHTFTLSSPGYQDQIIKASVRSGNRLIINAQLGVQTIIPTPTPTPQVAISTTPTPTYSNQPPAEITPLPKQASDLVLPKPYVQILTTPTGWLKVRSEANANASEVAKVNPEDKFPYLETSGSWYKIEYQTGKTGYISTTYAKLVN